MIQPQCSDFKMLSTRHQRNNVVGDSYDFAIDSPVLVVGAEHILYIIG
jgi:hypothetical protein